MCCQEAGARYRNSIAQEDQEFILSHDHVVAYLCGPSEGYRTRMTVSQGGGTSPLDLCGEILGPGLERAPVVSSLSAKSLSTLRVGLRGIYPISPVHEDADSAFEKTHRDVCQ